MSTHRGLAFPKIKAIVRDNGTAEVIVAGNSRIVAAGEACRSSATTPWPSSSAEARRCTPRPRPDRGPGRSG